MKRRGHPPAVTLSRGRIIASQSPARMPLGAIVLAVAAFLVPPSLRAQTETVAYWNLNSYIPGMDFTSSADSGSQAGTAILDWSGFNVAGSSVENPAPDYSTATGAYLATLPDGQTAGTGLGLISYSGSRSLDFKVSTVGLDFVTVSGYSNYGVAGSGFPGNWQYSTNGTTFSAISPTLVGGSLTFNSPQLANQANLTLRLSQYQSPNYYQYDNLAVSATTYNELAMSGERNKRIVQGNTQSLNYTLRERSGTAQDYILTTSGLTNVQDVANGANPNPTIIASGANSISGVVDTTSAVAGDTILATVTAASTTPGVDPASKTVEVQVIDNRVLSLAGSGDLGDLGRVVAGNPLATITIQTDGKTDSEATRITLNGGTYYDPLGWSSSYGPVGGLNFTVQNKAVFDSANETAEIVVRANPGVALGTQSFSANLQEATTGLYTAPGMFTAETAIGSNLSGLQPMQITGTATVLVNRDLESTGINLGREMIGEGTETVSGAGTVTVNGGMYGDLQGTRVNLNATTVGSPVTANGVSASIGTTTLFDSAYETASVDVTYSTTFDRSVAGTQKSSVNLAGQLSNGEDPSVGGVVLDSSLEVSVEKTFVKNRQIEGSSSVYVGALAGTGITSVSNHIYTEGADAENTRIRVNGVLFKDANYYEYNYDTVVVNQWSSVSKATTTLGTKTLTAVGEGLVGETPDSLSWDYGVYFEQAASASVSANIAGSPTGPLWQGNTGLTLRAGDTVTVATAAKDDGGNGERADTWVATGFVGNDGFSITNLGSVIIAGQTDTGTVAFDSAGKLNGTHSATLSLTLSNDLTLLGATYGDVGSYRFGVQHVVTGNSGNGGSAYVASGSRLNSAGISGSFSNSVLSQATTAALKDSETLGANVRIQLAFDSINNATGTGAEDLVSDMISLEGLDDITFVLQVSYDEDTLISKFGTEEVAILTWLDPEDNTWKNAIQGNSTYGVIGEENPFGTRFRMSYDDYLALQPDGTPRLNDYGYDPNANVMWAVLDHNSEFGGSGFGAVPEPSSVGLAMVGAVALFLRRRRVRR